MIESLNSVIRWCYFIAECGLIVLTFFGAHWFRGLGFQETNNDAVLLLSGVLCWVVASAWTQFRQVYQDHAKRIFAFLKTSVLFSLMLGLLAFAFKEAGYSRLIVAYFIILFSLGVLTLHLFGDLYFCALHCHRKLLRNVVMLGESASVQSLCSYIDSHPEYGYAEPTVYSLETASNSELLCRLVQQHAANDLVLVVPFGQNFSCEDVLEPVEKMGVRIFLLPDLCCDFPLPMKAGNFFGHPAFLLKHLPLEDAQNKVWKRLFDIGFSFTLLTVLSPLFLVFSLLIKASSKGPVFFKQQRTGYNQKSFKMLKFRSMRTDEKLADTKQATEDDPRITKIGRFMRKTNIDELPQFLNVLKGDMSVVGPRPHMLNHTKEFSGRVERYLCRHHVRPGITGWAQVNGWRGPTDTDEALENRVKHDLWYAENWSLMLDMKIIFLTVFGKKVRENAF